MKTRELALAAIFSALWTALQLSLGHIIGRVSIGPVSFHGTVNRIVGWLAMTVLAEYTVGFGKVTLMTAIAVTITRIQRANVFMGLIVGLGYVLAGVLFDLLMNLRSSRGSRYYMLIAVITGFTAIVPYWLFKIYLLGFPGFLLTFPVYAYSAAKGIVLSFIGVGVGLTVNKALKMFQGKRGSV